MSLIDSRSCSTELNLMCVFFYSLVSLIAYQETNDLDFYQPIIQLSYVIRNDTKLEREKEAGTVWREDSYFVVSMTHWLFNDEQIKGVLMVTKRSLRHCILDNSQDQQIDWKLKYILNSYHKILSALRCKSQSNSFQSTSPRPTVVGLFQPGARSAWCMQQQLKTRNLWKFEEATNHCISMRHRCHLTPQIMWTRSELCRSLIDSSGYFIIWIQYF